MSIWDDIYGTVSHTINDVDKALGGHLDSALNGLLHPTDEIGHFGRGVVDGLTMGAISAWDNTQRTKDYLENTGMSWGDIKYPSQTGAGSLGNYVARTGTQFVSKNIGRLYK